MTEFRVGYHHARKGSFKFGHPFYIHPTVYIDNTNDIYIGKGVTISRNTEIYTHDHYHDHETIEDDVRSNRIKTSPIIIGDDVYIGAGARILNSVDSIGDGAVVGAGSVVTKNIPAYEIWVGNPAIKLKNRKRLTNPSKKEI